MVSICVHSSRKRSTLWGIFLKSRGTKPKREEIHTGPVLSFSNEHPLLFPFLIWQVGGRLQFLENNSPQSSLFKRRKLSSSRGGSVGAESSVEVHCISITHLQGKARSSLGGKSVDSGSWAPKSGDSVVLERAEPQRGGLVHHYLTIHWKTSRCNQARLVMQKMSKA